MNLRKNKPGVESFIDFAHKKFEELELLKKDLEQTNKILLDLLNKYNKHKHYSRVNQGITSDELNYNEQVQLRSSY